MSSCECKQPVRARCISLGHVAPCEDPSCRGFFQVYKGCSLHPYCEGYNLEAQKKQKGRKRSMASDENDDEDDTPPEPEDAAEEGQNLEDPETAEKEDQTTIQGNPNGLTKSNSIRSQIKLMQIPKGGWNQSGLEPQPHAQKKRDKKSVHTAATESEMRKKARMKRRVD